MYYNKIVFILLFALLSCKRDNSGPVMAEKTSYDMGDEKEIDRRMAVMYRGAKAPVNYLAEFVSRDFIDGTTYRTEIIYTEEGKPNNKSYLYFKTYKRPLIFGTYYTINALQTQGSDEVLVQYRVKQPGNLYFTEFTAIAEYPNNYLKYEDFSEGYNLVTFSFNCEESSLFQMNARGRLLIKK